MKKIVYVDMDNVLVDFSTGIAKLSEELQLEYTDRLDEVPDIFSLMEPMPGAIEAYHEIAERYDTYILSTSPWENHTASGHKLQWVKTYLGKPAYKRLILSHHKHLNAGHYLIDDRTANGVDRFSGEHIHFGTDKFPDWGAVRRYLVG